jgi:LPXTG-motif cell wall-anchored protein
MLGNLAVENNITLTIAIRTSASYYGEDDPGGYPPQTGDQSHILLYSMLMILSLAGLLLLLAMAWKEREKKHA